MSKSIGSPPASLLQTRESAIVVYIASFNRIEQSVDQLVRYTKGEILELGLQVLQKRIPTTYLTIRLPLRHLLITSKRIICPFLALYTLLIKQLVKSRALETLPETLVKRRLQYNLSQRSSFLTLNSIPTLKILLKIRTLLRRIQTQLPYQSQKIMS